MPEILPSSRPKVETGEIILPGVMRQVPIYCANCGVKSGIFVQENLWQEVRNFACWLCDERFPNNCYAKWSPLLGVGSTPDEIFWEKIKQAQFEHFGRELTGPEIVEALKDDTHILSKLAKERPR